MRKRVHEQAKGEAHPVICEPGGGLNPEFFNWFVAQYKALSGFEIVYADSNGCIQMGLPECKKFPCQQSCRDCRETIISEALRSGRVCADHCHEGFLIWGLPLSVEGRLLGGLIVIGVSEETDVVSAAFRKACEALHGLMRQYGLLPGIERLQATGLGEPPRLLRREHFKKVHALLEGPKQRYTAALVEGDLAAADRELAGVKAGFLAARGLPKELVRGLLIEWLMSVQRAFADSGLDRYASLAEIGGMLEGMSELGEIGLVTGYLDRAHGRFQHLAAHETKRPEDLLIERVVIFIEAHLRETLSREYVAHGVGISPSQLSRLLRRKKGRTFTDLLNQYRIERASKLLVRSAGSVAEIAAATGFADQSYFSKVFKQYKGVTPAEFRNSHW